MSDCTKCSHDNNANNNRRNLALYIWQLYRFHQQIILKIEPAQGRSLIYLDYNHIDLGRWGVRSSHNVLQLFCLTGTARDITHPFYYRILLGEPDIVLHRISRINDQIKDQEGAMTFLTPRLQPSALSGG